MTVIPKHDDPRFCYDDLIPEPRRRADEESRRQLQIAANVGQPLSEIRIVDPETGGAKGKKAARFDLLPAGPLWEVAELYGEGAIKYGDRNFELGYAWSLSFAAMMRHAWQFWSGEDRDAETGKHHLASVVFHAMALMLFGETHPEKDDSPGAGARRRTSLGRIGEALKPYTDRARASG
jgi:hypothetical protein